MIHPIIQKFPRNHQTISIRTVLTIQPGKPPREKFSRYIQDPIRRGWKTGTKPNYENVAAPEVLYDYLTEHAATSGRFVPFKYMIARDFSTRVSPSPRGPTHRIRVVGTRTRFYYSPLQVFHLAAPG